MFLGDFHFDQGQATVINLDGVAFCDKDNYDEMGEQLMDLFGPNGYICPDIYKGKIISKTHWYCQDEYECYVVFDKELQLVCGFNHLSELKEDYPNAQAMNGILLFSWEKHQEQSVNHGRT